MDYKFKAFISYRHVPRDTTVAKALHTTIEKYIIPRKLREKGVKRLGKVFRDEEELSASSDLSQHIRDALDAAEYLIVICSTDTLESNWVFKEITYFLEHHPKEKLLTVLTGGDSAQIYEKLLTGLPEPLSLDLRKSSDSRLARDLKALFLKLCAPLLGCEYDDLVMRDLKRRRRRILAWIAGIGIVAATIISILLWSNYQIEGKNTELEQQNNEILLRESELLTQDAADALQKEDRAAAIRYALDALGGGNDNRPYYAPAESILIQALGGSLIHRRHHLLSQIQ